MDYERFWSIEARRFKDASLAGLAHRFSGVDGVINLAGGLPPADAFPITAFSATTCDGVEITLGAEGQQAYLAQQYNFNPQGYKPLLDWLRDLTFKLHSIPITGAPSQLLQQHLETGAAASSKVAPPHAPLPPPSPPPRHANPVAAAAIGTSRDLVLTSGATNAICAIISCLTDPGDTLVVDEYTFTHALECVFLPRDLRLLPVGGDAEGMDPEELHRQLAAAAAAAETGGCRRPRLAYFIPTGHNPTGTTMSEQRRRRILEVCEAHDLLVVEDDAYYWLYYPGGSPPVSGLTGLPRSMASLDTSGRVIRIDTFSKLLGPGYRLGWITAPQPLVSKLSNWVMASSVGPCSMAQVLVARLLHEWGMDGFAAHVRRLQVLYASRSLAAHEAAMAHLKGLADWQPVEAGMFMWIKVLGVPDIATILDDLVAAKVVAVPGSMFATRGLQATLDPLNDVPAGSQHVVHGSEHHAATGNTSPYLRLSFAGSTPEVLAKGLQRLAEVIRGIVARSGSQ